MIPKNLDELHANLTASNIFNFIAEHLLRQGEKSQIVKEWDSKEHPHCVYRGPNGLMCGAGPLIPDQSYDQSMEGTRILPIIEKYHDQEWAKVLLPHTALLDSLQDCHDCFAVKDWPSRLIRIAAMTDSVAIDEWSLLADAMDKLLAGSEV